MLSGLFDDRATETAPMGRYAVGALALQLPGYRCEALVRQGLAALNAARPEEAFLPLVQACSLQPQRADLRALLGHCLERMDAHDAHYTFVQASLKRFASSPPLRQQFWRASSRSLSREALQALIYSQLAEIEDPAELKQVLALLAPLPGENSLVGVVRHETDSNALSGWVVDLSEPNRPLSVQLKAAGQSSTYPADHPFALLAKSGVNDGRGGFRVALSQPLAAIEVAIAGVRPTPLCGSPVAAVAALSPPPPATRDPSRQPVCVLIPVFKGLESTLACIDSVLAARPRNRTRHRIVVLDDASPDVALAQALESRAKKGQIEYVRRPANLGFIRNMNRGMAAQPSSDVVWLNADTLVHGDWLDRLRAAAYSADAIASATPWSNNGELMSFPQMRTAHRMPAAKQLAQLDRLASRLSTQTVDIEVGCGFCLYVKRRALEHVGYLDEVELQRGYGEETDWCLRARSLGWRHVAATRVFVAHEGGCSFGAEKALRVEQNNRVLRRRYPDAERRFDTFVARDPLVPARTALQEAAELAAVPLPDPQASTASCHNTPLPQMAPPQLPGRCWLIADPLDSAAIGERWLALARQLKRNGGAITLLLTQPTPWQPQLARAGVVFVPELEGIAPQRVLALSGARLALSLSEAPFDEEDPRVAQARLAGLPLFAPSARGLAPVGAYDATLLAPYFNDSVLTL